MFLVFGWKAGQQMGGTYDLINVCGTEIEALAFVESLLHTDSMWEFHITDETLTTQYESASVHMPATAFSAREPN
jgi:hypothetical protein